MKPDVRVELECLEKLVSGAGFGLHNPLNGVITLIDDEGEFHDVDRAALVSRIAQRKDTSFQFWELEWVGNYPGDLYCRLVFKKEASVVEFGWLPRELDPFLVGAWSFSREKLDDGGILGFVIDRHGITEEYADWDAFFLRRNAYDGPCPDVLCVTRDQEQLLPETCASHRRHERLHHIVMCSEGIERVLGLQD
jgi:hypothetical protein